LRHPINKKNAAWVKTRRFFLEKIGCSKKILTFAAAK
jgi:hypothetical protein